MKYVLCALLTLCLLVQGQAMDIGDDEPLSGETATISMSQIASGLGDLSLAEGATQYPPFMLEECEEVGSNLRRTTPLKIGLVNINPSISHVLISPIEERGLFFQSYWPNQDGEIYIEVKCEEFNIELEDGITSFPDMAEHYREKVVKCEEVTKQAYEPLVNLEDGEVSIDSWWSSPEGEISVEGTKIKMNTLFETKEKVVIKSTAPGGVVRRIEIESMKKDGLFFVSGVIDFSREYSPFFDGFRLVEASVIFEFGDI